MAADIQEVAMFSPSIHVECIVFSEQAECAWGEEDVKTPTDEGAPVQEEEEDFLAFCRRSLW